MLKNKRVASTAKSKPKDSNKQKQSSSIKQKEIKTKRNNKLAESDDEEINSESSIDSNEVDKKNLTSISKLEDQQGKKTIFAKEYSKAISSDERRLLMAKTLINSVKNKEEDADAEDIVDEELAKTKADYCQELSKNLKESESYDYSFIKCHLGGITSLNFLDNHTLITTSKDRRSMLIDLNTEKKTLLPAFTNKQIYTCAIARDRKNLLFAGADKKIHVFNLETNKILNTCNKAHTETITKLVIDPENEQVYSVSKDNILKMWGLNSYNNLVHMETFYGHTSYIYDLDYLSTNRLISCGSDANILQWKIDSQSYLQYKQGDSSYECISAINKNYFYAGDYDGSLKLFSLNKKKQISEVKNYSKDKSYDPTPILSMYSVKNTDLLFTGTTNGTLNIYQCNYSKGNKINNVRSIRLKENGIVSAITANNENVLALAYSKEAKNGRWDVDYDLKHSGIAIVKLFE